MKPKTTKQMLEELRETVNPTPPAVKEYKARKHIGSNCMPPKKKRK